jgi:hypothetical protein
MATSKQARQATAYYVRVSSQSQDIRSQIPEMEAHSRGHDPVRWYRDAFTGTQMERPGWDKLMADLWQASRQSGSAMAGNVPGEAARLGAGSRSPWKRRN